MSDDFKVISEFCCHGKQIVTVRIGNAAHVMSLEEWYKIYSRNHQDKWKTRIDWNRFVPREKYNQCKVS